MNYINYLLQLTFSNVSLKIILIIFLSILLITLISYKVLKKTPKYIAKEVSIWLLVLFFAAILIDYNKNYKKGKFLLSTYVPENSKKIKIIWDKH